jgi:SAM-dependent methyltransferase
VTVISDAKQRFSNRVDDYVRYRPTYPHSVLDLLEKDCGLTPNSVIADIGSGTGISAQLFLANGNVVYGVEPNADMRVAGEEFLKTYPKFHSVTGSAETATLPDHIADFIVAGQAFHWFDTEPTRKEFQRILKPSGWVVLIWNERKLDGTTFLLEYENLLRTYGTDYDAVAARYPQNRGVEEFFISKNYHKKAIPNEQQLDLNALRGRLMSSSYAPVKDHENYEPMMTDLARIFSAHEHQGHVRFEYETRIFYGRVADFAKEDRN